MLFVTITRIVSLLISEFDFLKISLKNKEQNHIGASETFQGLR